jgi:hypothetical protein
VWASPTQLEALHAARFIAFDGTFARAPKAFYQLFCVLAKAGTRMLPVAWAWLQGKERQDYLRVWQALFPADGQFSVARFIAGGFWL